MANDHIIQKSRDDAAKLGGTHQAVIEFFADQPTCTLAEISAACHVSRERCRKILQYHGLRTNGRYGPMFHRVQRVERADYHFRYGRELAASVSGKIGEWYVWIDLIKRGYHVYFAVADHSPCDLIAQRDDKLIRVEVRSARRSKRGGVSYVKSRVIRYDVLAAVFPDGSVEYFTLAGFQI